MPNRQSVFPIFLILNGRGRNRTSYRHQASRSWPALMFAQSVAFSTEDKNRWDCFTMRPRGVEPPRSFTFTGLSIQRVFRFATDARIATFPKQRIHLSSLARCDFKRSHGCSTPKGPRGIRTLLIISCFAGKSRSKRIEAEVRMGGVEPPSQCF